MWAQRQIVIKQVTWRNPPESGHIRSRRKRRKRGRRERNNKQKEREIERVAFSLKNLCQGRNVGVSDYQKLILIMQSKLNTLGYQANSLWDGFFFKKLALSTHLNDHQLCLLVCLFVLSLPQKKLSGLWGSIKTSDKCGHLHQTGPSWQCNHVCKSRVHLQSRCHVV